MKCKKCSASMHGPLWNERVNTLMWTCTCGFKGSEPAHDAKKAAKTPLQDPEEMGYAPK